MIYDGIYGYFKGYNRLEFLYHHILVMGMILEVHFKHKFGNEIVYCFWIGEFSNPFLNIVAILDFYNGDYEKIKTVLNVIFFVSFLPLRAFVYTVIYGV